MNEVLKQMKNMDDKQQLKFMLSNPTVFVDNPLMFILGTSNTLQQRLSYLKYLQLLNNIALQKRNTALLKATETAMKDVVQLKL